MEGIYPTPANIDLEKKVLGVILWYEKAIFDCIDTLSENSFFDLSNRAVWNAIYSVYKQSSPISTITVGQQLRVDKKLKVADLPYLSELTNSITGSDKAYLDKYLLILKEYEMRRDGIDFAKEYWHKAHRDDEDVKGLGHWAAGQLMKINDSHQLKAQSSNQQLAQTIKEIESAVGKDGLTGVPCGIKEVDKITGGWQNSNFIVLAARPSVGKTAFSLGVADNAAIKFGKKVLFASLEMSSTQLHTRRISRATGYSSDDFRRPENLDWEMIHANIRSLETDNLFIVDNPSMDVFQLRAYAQRQKARTGLDMVVVDYIQLLQGDRKGNREQEIGSVSRTLKMMSIEMNIPVIGLSQLSRGVESRADKRPLLSDLRESGSIEQDADVVCFLYRDEYYKIDTDSEGRPTKGIAELIFAKHRNGKLGTAKMRFIGSNTTFRDIDYVPELPTDSTIKPNSDFEIKNFGDEVPF